jgi:hypothetical protein
MLPPRCRTAITSLCLACVRVRACVCVCVRWPIIPRLSIPNVGTVLAVALPMPLVVLDPAFSSAGAALAFFLPLSAHAFAGNVLEPLLFGHTLKLHPVVVLLSLLLWGAVWGVTGMVLAVPITAVLRIRLTHIKHPLPQFLASLLVGENEPPTATASPVIAASEGGRDEEDAVSSSGLLPPPSGGPTHERARTRLLDTPQLSAQPLEAAEETVLNPESGGAVSYQHAL